MVLKAQNFQFSTNVALAYNVRVFCVRAGFLAQTII